MKIEVRYKDQAYQIDLTKGIDISLRLSNGSGPNCFWAPLFEASPVKTDEFVGSTAEGGLVNFFNLRLNPHGNGTHTECVGHIAKEQVSISDVLKSSLSFARLISVYPERQKNGDLIITKELIMDSVEEWDFDTLIIRTLPNDDHKRTKSYSGTNPPYFHHSAISYIVAQGIDHLMSDLPSVDREEDEGLLLGHKAFWNYPEILDTNKTISELIYATNDVRDGLYLCETQIININLDVSPSRIRLHRM